jgi:steroid 5-alpha reductase family enzyme
MWPEFAIALAASAGGIAVCMLLLWLISIPLRDVSIVDIFWGPGFAVAAWAAFAFVDGAGPHGWVAAVLTTIWALRLGAYLVWRKRGHGEDPRYTAFINHLGAERRHWTGLTRVFGMQAAIMWVVAWPVVVAQVWSTPADLGPAAWAGIAIWTLGFLFESVGDWQLVRFRADPANAGKVMDRGLWRYTRHPNYFGDACVWWGLFLLACDNPWGLVTILSPVLMTFFLVKRTGKALLERRLKRSRPDYEDYIRRTSGFIPWPPRA